MEYLNHAEDMVEAVILHPDFKSEETIMKIHAICDGRIPVTTEEKPFNILSKKDNCFVIAAVRKETQKIEPGKPHGSGVSVKRGKPGYDYEELPVRRSQHSDYSAGGR